MTTYCKRPETLLTETDLTALRHDAHYWRALQRILISYGFTNMTPEKIASIFPNFRAFPPNNAFPGRVPPPNDYPTRRAPASGSPPVRKEAVKKPLQQETPHQIQVHHNMIRLESAQALDEALVFAEVLTSIGPCEVACTLEGDLLFLFTVTHEILLLPIADIVQDIVNQLYPPTRQPDVRHPLI